MACNKKITQSILFDCENLGVAGIDNATAVLVNFADVDKASSTVSAGTISDLVLFSGTTGYSLEWYKDLANATATYAPDAEAVDGFQHSFLGRITTSTAEASKRANELKNGRFVLIVEGSFKGTNNADAFKVFGYETGLYLSELNFSINENSGNILFTVATKEGSYEQYPYHTFLETNYATSSATFAALFANP